MHAISKLVFASALLAMITAAAAQTGSGVRWTAGSGVESSRAFGENFALRGWWQPGAPGAEVSAPMATEHASFTTRLLIADWHPGGTGFRLSGGFGHAPVNFEGGVRLHTLLGPARMLETLEPQPGLSRPNPYLGIGWGRSPGAKGGLYVSADVGLLLQREAGGQCALLTAAVCRSYDALRSADAERSLLNDLHLSPRISFGFGLRF
jgi:hypothetical protein